MSTDRTTLEYLGAALEAVQQAHERIQDRLDAGVDDLSPAQVAALDDARREVGAARDAILRCAPELGAKYR